MVGFSVNIDETHAVPIIRVTGEIDVYSCPQLRTTLNTLVNGGSNDVILDLEDIQYIDSTGLGTIAHTARSISDKNGRILVICNKTHIKKIFEVSGLEKKNIQLFDTEASVLKEIHKDS